MRGVPNPQREQPLDPMSLTVAVPSFVPKEPLSPELAALGREVLALVPRKPLPTLEAYRQAAEGLSRVLRVTKLRIKPQVLYYAALRVKWMQDAVRE